MANITILGCGFGTALAVMWRNAGHNVTAYSNSREEIETIKRDGEHKKLLPGVKIPDGVGFTSDISLVRNAEIVVFAVPSKYIREVAVQARPYVTGNAVIVSVSKGFEEKSGMRLSEVISSVIPNNPMVVLTGPCHAEEVGRSLPTAVVASSEIQKSAEYIQNTLQTERFRIYMNSDIVGCELGGSLKNPIALCCGIASGMGLGDNTKAAIMTRGLAEIRRLGSALGAKWQTFTGLSGVGDLIVTCTSQHSRNFRAGMLIGQGVPAAEAVGQTGTVEGFECLKTALRLAVEHGVEMPIFGQLYKVCFEGVDPKLAVRALMERPQKDEREFFWEV